MMLHIPGVLTLDEVRYCRTTFDKAAWVDGRITAGFQSGEVKRNLQLPENSPEARELGDIVMAGLGRSPLFVSAVLPKTVFPPLFNRYDSGMTFGSHVDNAVRTVAENGVRVRTDVSSTLFLSDPDQYDGGELVVEDTFGAHAVKLPAGDMIVYPGTSLHHVTPITRGSRIASFFWTQSMVRDDSRRRLLFELDASITRLRGDHPGHASILSLTNVYHNMLREWVDL